MDDFERQLAGLGVTADRIPLGRKSALDQQGYMVIPDLLDERWLPPLRDLFESEVTRHGEATPGVVSHNKRESGTRHVDQLEQHKVAINVCTSPEVLAAAYYLLKRRFRITMMHGRDPLPGFGQQGLHRDWHIPKPGTVEIVTAIALLDPFTAENGATRVVAGSHIDPRPIGKRLSDPAYIHNSQVVIEANQGSVLVFNGHLMHSATRNRSTGRRRTIQFSFVGFENRMRIMETDRNLDKVDPNVRFLFE